MTAAVRQLLGLTVAIVSFIGTITICAVPRWRVTETNNAQLYQGLWKYCISFSTYTTTCTAYDVKGLLVQTSDLVDGRALIVIAIIVGVIGILLGAAGTNFINFVPDKRKKSKMTMASGVVFLIAGFFVLISVCWITNTTIGKVDFVPPDVSLKWDLGASIYIGWITTVLLFLGGGLLCSSFLCRDGTD